MMNIIIVNNNDSSLTLKAQSYTVQKMQTMSGSGKQHKLVAGRERRVL